MRLVTEITKGRNNKLYPEDIAGHDWYRFVLSFPPHLVRDYASQFARTSQKRLLDPFCGTGTTLLESKKLGLPSVGIEAAPMAHFATRVKIDWSPNPAALRASARRVVRRTRAVFAKFHTPEIAQSSFTGGKAANRGLLDLPADAKALLLSDSISPIPLHKTLILLDQIRQESRREVSHLQLALAKALISGIGNVAFGPEIGVTKPKHDCPVLAPWLRAVDRMSLDLEFLHQLNGNGAKVYKADSRAAISKLEPRSIDLILTSPPYPNEKDYTRTTRLESVILGFLHNKTDLQKIKRSLVRSNTRNIYKGDTDSTAVAHLPQIKALVDEIEERRRLLRKTSGFERLYGTVTKEYFGGMARHLEHVKSVLRKDAHLVYVVGDQASFFQVHIRTGRLLAEVAESLGYAIQDIQLFRSRLSTKTRKYMREEAVILRWPGPRTAIAIDGLKNMKRTPVKRIAKPQNRYIPIMEALFAEKFRTGRESITFSRDDLERISKRLRINLPKNFWDVIYSFRHRVPLPAAIQNTAAKGKAWTIKPKGAGGYAFELAPKRSLRPGASLAITKIPDSTPGVVALYASNEKQALLSKLRYNELVTIFTSVKCYSIQNHFRTFVAGIGQIDTDEIYIGIDKKGSHYVMPLQARTEKEELSPAQVDQAIALCASKFPTLICRPIGAQFTGNDRIALFEFEQSPEGVSIVSEKHYQLAPPSDFTPELLEQYKKRLSTG